MVGQLSRISAWAATLLMTLICLVLFAHSSSAQITSGTISGTIRDETGGVLPGATVTITNQDTGIVRTVVSDQEGQYRATNLAVGTYEVRGELAGFRSVVRRGVVLTVGRHAVVDLAVQVGELSEEVVVTGTARLVDTQTSIVAGIVEEKQIRELPLNLRSYEQLVSLQPGVTTGESLNRVSVRGGSGTQLYIAGARSEFNEFQIDNVEAGDVWGKTPGGMSGGVLGVESIKEFSVLTSSYSAEYGKAAGGVVNVITRAGANRLDGTAYLFHRNESLDAKNYFDREKPEFTRNQFGAAIGGPAIRNKTFFFANYEGLRQDLPETVTGLVPTANARLGILPNRTVSVNPAVVPYLALYPLPNGPEHGDGTADFIRPVTQRTVADYVLFRVDHQLGSKHSLTGRHIYEDGDRVSPHSVLDAQTGVLEGKKHNGSIQYQTIISPGLVNEFRFGLNQSEQNDYDLFEGLSPDLNFVPLPGRVLGSLEVTGLSTFGHSGSQPLFFTYKSFQFINHLTYMTGRHSLRVGADVRRLHVDAMNVAALHGVYRFNGLEQFLQGQTRDFRFLVPGAGRDEPFNIRQSLFGFYAQDDFKARSNLTLNLGLRYEFITVPTEAAGKVASLRDISDTRTTVGDPVFKNPSLKNFGPRLGLAWDPTGSGRTSVRAGWGLFFNQIAASYLPNTMFRMPPFFVRTTIANPAFPDQFSETVGGRDLETLDVYALGEALELQGFKFEIENPYMMNYQVSLQRELFADAVLTAAYVGSRGYNLNRVADVNTPVPQRRADGKIVYPSTGDRLNPTWVSVPQNRFDARSFYHSLQLAVRKRFSQGLLFQNSYTFSRSIDDASGTSGGGDGFASSNTHGLLADDPLFDRGHSAFDVRHVFSTTAVWELPFGSGTSGLANAFLGGWQVSGTVSLRSGTHASVYLSADRARNLSGLFFGQRPDLVPGADPNPINPGNSNQYIDPASFAVPERFTLGNLPRGTITLPGMASVDMSFTKSVSLPGATRVQFRAEVFNLLNRANFGTPNLTVFAGTAANPTLSPTFGRITSTSTSARQVQLGLKILF